MSESEPKPVLPQHVPVFLPQLLSRITLALALVLLALAGLVLGLLGSFHLPDRPLLLGVHWPAAVLLGLVGNLGLGLFAGWGLEGRSGPAAAFLGWIVGVGVAIFGGTDDVVVGGASGDWVPLGFLVAGVVGGLLALAVSLRFRPAPGLPRVLGTPRADASLRTPDRR